METKEEKQLNDWLPITKSRNAKWWYSAFHNVTAMVGAGVLGLPYAMSHLGWFVSNIFSLYNQTTKNPCLVSKKLREKSLECEKQITFLPRHAFASYSCAYTEFDHSLILRENFLS